MKPKRKIQTDLIHAGEEEKVDHSVVFPIFQSATFVSQDESAYEDIRYLRLNNSPNHRVLNAKIASVCCGEAAVVTSSGMAAISATLLSLLKTGDHVLVQNCLYGGTHSLFVEDLPDFGISVDFIDGNRPESWAAKIREKTRVIFVETMTNPLLEVADLEAIVVFAHNHGLIAVVDNTFGTPINYRPLDHGYDVEIHSATKYLNGHSDIVAGCIISTHERIERIVRRLNHIGPTLDPHACFLLQRGLKTLALRVHHQNTSAQALSEKLLQHDKVARVHYAGLPAHPQHRRAGRLFSGFGGVLSFELHEGLDAAGKLMSLVQIPTSAPSLGGVETLITRPAITSHAGLTDAQCQALGISQGLIRVAVGIESVDDLLADFELALSKL